MTQQSHDDTQVREQPNDERTIEDPVADAPDTEEGREHLVPVAESIRYRRRAQQAEQRLAEVTGQLESERSARASAEAELAQTRRRAELTRLLLGRGVIDLEAALLLAEHRLEQADPDDERPEGDRMSQVIEQLLQEKPYLHSAPPEPLSAASPRDTESPGEATVAAEMAMTTPTRGRRGPNGSADQLRAAARRAASGRQEDLDHYLRVRRRFH